MVWAIISFDGRTELRVIDEGSPTAIRYRDSIVDQIAKHIAGAIGDDWCSCMTIHVSMLLVWSRRAWRRPEWG